MTIVSVLPVAAALTGAMVGGGIGFLTARYTTGRTAQVAVASRLRAAFIPELVAMKFDRNGDKFDPDKLLRSHSRVMPRPSKNTGSTSSLGIERLTKPRGARITRPAAVYDFSTI